MKRALTGTPILSLHPDIDVGLPAFAPAVVIYGAPTPHLQASHLGCRGLCDSHGLALSHPQNSFWTHFLSLKALSAFFCTLCLPRAAGNLLGYFKYVFLIDSSHWVRNGPCVVKTGPKQPESKRAHRNPLAQAQPWGVLPTSDFQWGRGRGCSVLGWSGNAPRLGGPAVLVCRWEGTPRSAQDNGVALGLVCERWGVCEKGVHVRVRVGVFALP